MGSTNLRIRRASGRLTAQTLDDLAACAVGAIGTASIRDLRVRIDQYRLPRGWIGSPALHGLQALSVTPRGAGVDVYLGVESPKDVAVLAAAVLRVLSPIRGPRGTFSGPLPAAASMLAPAIRDVFADDEHEHLRRADDVFGSQVVDGSRHIVPSDDGHWLIDGQRHDVWVDPAVHRPIGRPDVSDPVIADAPRVSWLDSAQVGSLRNVGAVRGSPSPRITAQLHASGILLESEFPVDDPFAAQVASVRARRDSYRRFSWMSALDSWPTVSAVMMTNRPTYLEKILATMRNFEYPRLQCVIGLHGVDPRTVHLNGIDATVVSLDPGLPFGAAMQRLSDAADGELITKIDDDDIYGPEHIWDLVIAKQYSGAQIVGKALDWIYLADEQTTVFRPVYGAEKYGKFVAGGTIMIDRESLASVGGWRPVPRSIDRALLESVRGAGGLVYRTHGLGYMYVRRASGHTAQVDNAHFRTRVERVVDGCLSHEEFGTG